MVYLCRDVQQWLVQCIVSSISWLQTKYGPTQWWQWNEWKHWKIERSLNLSRITRTRPKFSKNMIDWVPARTNCETKNSLRRSDTAIWVWTTYSQTGLQMFQYAAAAVWVFFITVLNRLHTCYSSTNLFISLAAHLSIQQKFLPAGHRH